MTIFAMSWRGAVNSLRRHPWRYLAGALPLGLLCWGMLALTRRGVHLLDSYPLLGTIADAVLQRSLEALFLILMAGVAFSVITTAVTTLYSAEDLPFLLSLPAPPVQVFYLKMVETYLSAALLPALFTLPVIVGIGLERSAALTFYPTAIAAVLALYAIPAALGAVIALLLMRASPAGRVKELATAASVVLAAGLIFALRLIRPEQLTALTPHEFEQLLGALARFEIGWLPSTWASQAVWGALHGQPSPGAFVLAGASLLLLWLVAQLASFAYREGWLRTLDSDRPRLDPTPRRAAWWERLFAPLGRGGSIMIKDLRLLWRDPTQWSQLLVLLALAGVYLVSVGGIAVEGQRFRDVLGTINLMFLGFLLAGVGMRLAYPIVSLEGEGFWLLRTGPLHSRQIVWAKFLHALPIMALLGTGLGLAVAHLVDLSPTLAFAAPLAGLCAAIAITGLGVGLGAAFPRFDATSPAEIPLSPGGLLYMTLSLAYAGLMTLLLAWPAWQALRAPGLFYWGQSEGQLLLLALAGLTLITTIAPLAYGSGRLSRYEAGS